MWGEGGGGVGVGVGQLYVCRGWGGMTGEGGRRGKPGGCRVSLVSEIEQGEGIVYS